MADYEKMYGNIPKNIYERFIYLKNLWKLSDVDVSNVNEKIKKTLSKRSWNVYEFTFYIVPEAAPRPRVSSRGIFYVKGAKQDYIFFEKYLKDNYDEYIPVVTPCNFYCEAYMPIPENMNKIEKVLAELNIINPVSIPDWDNIGKKYCDMVQKNLIINDSLVIDGRVKKLYSSKPRVYIRIEFLNKHDSKYNKNKIESWKHYKENPNVLEMDNLIK